MSHDARAVANYLLSLAAADAIPVTPLKIQKLVYLAHGWSLALRQTALIYNNVEAWRYGPVVSELYHAFKQYGPEPITEKAYVRPGDPLIDSATGTFIKSVWNAYKKYSGLQLSAMTHEKGYAWDLATAVPANWFTPRISNTLIADEFIRRQASGKQ
jgi:uncharacterized phage-associated protein